MIVVALAGLPGAGKSTLARRLAAELDAPLLDKDAVRAALFGRWADGSREQDETCMRAIHAAVESLAGRVSWVVLDGRTYSRRAQVDALRALARRAGAALRLIECTCAPAEAERRLASDADAGAHPAPNRDARLHRELAAAAEPIQPPELVLATDSADLEELVRRALAYARG